MWAADDHDLASRLADRVSRAAGVALSPDDLWPACGLLADAGLLASDEEFLGVRHVGPFRVANTPYRRAVADFLDVGLPSLVAGLATGTPTAGAVSGLVGSLSKTFVEVGRRGVVFGGSRDAQVRWVVLHCLHEARAAGRPPAALDDLAGQVGRVVLDGRPIRRTDVARALRWLAGDEGGRRLRRAPLVRRGDDGTYEALT